MEAVIKLNIIDCSEEEWLLDEYAKGKFQNLTDEDLTEVVAEIIRETIAKNGVYCNCDDAEIATQEILPSIASIILTPRFSHLRMDYNLLIEVVTYLTVRLA
ncbi:MAG: hypothetical protein R3Y68_08935 [Rikenellaceae bacterium]